MPLPADGLLPPVPAGTPALSAEALAAGLAALAPGWVVEGGHLVRRVPTADFAGALALAVRLGLVAERADHHPTLTVRWGELAIEVWTHTTDGLSPLDLELARRCDPVIGDATPPAR
ncbi:MAG: 4a-hydroxytetrahydrobiopterin dehydratase [Kofleriaceae bacterium]